MHGASWRLSASKWAEWGRGKNAELCQPVGLSNKADMIDHGLKNHLMLADIEQHEVLFDADYSAFGRICKASVEQIERLLDLGFRTHLFGIVVADNDPLDEGDLRQIEAAPISAQPKTSHNWYLKRLSCPACHYWQG